MKSIKEKFDKTDLRRFVNSFKNNEKDLVPLLFIIYKTENGNIIYYNFNYKLEDEDFHIIATKIGNKVYISNNILKDLEREIRKYYKKVEVMNQNQVEALAFLKNVI